MKNYRYELEKYLRLCDLSESDIRSIVLIAEIWRDNGKIEAIEEFKEQTQWYTRQ